MIFNLWWYKACPIEDIGCIIISFVQDACLEALSIHLSGGLMDIATFEKGSVLKTVLFLGERCSRDFERLH